MDNLTLLERLVNEDFGYSRTGRRWGRSEKHSSLVVDAEKQVFYFNSQEGKSGSTLDYLMKVRNLSFQDAKNFLKLHADYTDSYVHHHIKGNEVITYPPLAESFWEVGKMMNKRDYFYKRGLTDNSIDRFKLGFYMTGSWYTVPMYSDGLLTNIQLRKESPSKQMGKYYRGVGASLFNGDILKLANEVFFVEGPLDAIAVIQNDGIPVVSTDSGSAFNTEWLVKFAKVKQIYIVFDNDKAGRVEAKRLSNVLGDTRCKIYTFEGYEDKFDPVDFYLQEKKDLYNLVKEKAKFSFEMGKEK